MQVERGPQRIDRERRLKEPGELSAKSLGDWEKEVLTILAVPRCAPAGSRGKLRHAADEGP